MRPEVLYEYDLPLEILDEIPADEEVLEVLYARSSENYHLPILITRLRIVCAYPETSVVYRVFQIDYVDLAEVHVKFTRGLSTVLTFTRLDGEMNVFDRVRNTHEEIRAALLTLRDLMIEKVGGEWQFQHRQNLLTDEYAVKESDPVLSSVPTIPAEDLFEDKEMPGLGCYEPTEKLFEHFPQDAEDGDVFEESAEILPETDAELKAVAMNSRIQRMIETAEIEAEHPEITDTGEVSVNDATVLESGPAVTDSQWANEDGGDAVILPDQHAGSRQSSNGTRAAVPLVPVDEDDSEVYVTPKPSPKKQKEEEAATMIAEELDKLPVPEAKEPAKSPLPALLPRAVPVQVPAVLPADKGVIPMSITLEPQDSFEEETVDACLESLKLLRDTGVISEEEYKDRCLRLFKTSSE